MSKISQRWSSSTSPKSIAQTSRCNRKEWIRMSMQYDRFGYTSASLVTPNRASTATKTHRSQVFTEVKRHRGERTNLDNNTRTMTEHNPLYDSRSNGYIGGMTRRLRADKNDDVHYRGAIGETIDIDNPTIPWRAMHAAMLINRVKKSNCYCKTHHARESTARRADGKCMSLLSQCFTCRPMRLTNPACSTDGCMAVG